MGPKSFPGISNGNTDHDLAISTCSDETVSFEGRMSGFFYTFQ